MPDRMEKDLLEARLDDAVLKCEAGCPATLPFLTPRDARRAERYLRTRGMLDAAWFWGGYPDAERVTLFLLPDYLTLCLSASPSECTPDEMLALLGEEATDAVSSLLIRGSGFRTLSHRDFLGAVLGLGIERDAIGDIALQNEREAVLFCPLTIGRFLRETLTRVGSDAVKVLDYTPDEHFTDGRHYRPISDTVASERLDCVVAALCNLSRDAAQALIRSGAVEVEFEPVDRTDYALLPPQTLSVRGYGRFILRAFDGETRKGRLRLRADMMV